MSGLRHKRWILAVASLLIGGAASFLKLAFHCREPASEACVWSKAYYPVTLPVESVAFGAVIFLVMIGIEGARRS